MTETGPDLEPHVVRNNPTAMPSGLVTFLFTDIEGSTKLWEAHPRAMKSALARHDAIMREAIGSNGGVVFKTIGDAFCAAFSHAPSALLAAVDAQRGLSNESWSETGPLRARMALHTGETDERDGDYFGPPVNRVARLLATGHGGQILVSDETRVLLQPELPQETDLRDMGEHRLKDLARPQRVYQACVSGLPDEFAPLRGQPSPFRGIVIAAAAVLAIIVLFRLWIRGSDESIAKALSPSGLYQGYKGLIVELSAQNEWWLLAIGLLLLLTAIGLTIARWRASNRTLQLVAEPPNRFERWFVNQRAIAGVAVAAVLVLGAWGYQQYLWRVALPIPDDAIGFAMTREASAATVHDALEEKLYTDGQAKRVVIREIPVKFDSSDIPTAREIGERIGAEAVVIYDVENTDDGKEYVAYVVFTDPTVGSTFGGSTETTDASEASASGGTQIAQAKPELDVPVLRSETLDQLIDAAAGIIDYHNDRIRESITYLEQAMPAEPDAPNTGLVGFYLGNAYRLDGQMPQADQTLERAAAYYEGQQQATGELTPQDTLTLVQTYFWRGFNAWNEENWDDAILWGQKAVDYKEDLVARKDGLERPSDARATYARIYALMTEASRSSGKTDDERFWRQRTTEEVTAIAAEAAPGDPIPFLQSG